MKHLCGKCRKEMKCMNCDKIIDPPWEYARVCLDIIPDADNDGHSIFYQEKNLCDQCWKKVKDVF